MSGVLFLRLIYSYNDNYSCDRWTLHTIANKVAGDTLKMAKNGNAWGAMKTATGGSKMVQLGRGRTSHSNISGGLCN